MNRRSLSYDWPKEDRLMWVRWRWYLAFFYGCAALLIFGSIILTKLSSPASDEAGRLRAARANPGAGLSGNAQ